MRSLVLNLGNTSLLGGVFDGARLVSRFRVPRREVRTARGFTSLVVPRVRGRVDRIALCSVVPRDTDPLARRLERAFDVAPALLDAGAPHGLRIGYPRPRELGTDRLAAALGARTLLPGANVIVIDCGTASTLTAVTADGLVAGGAILPGVGLWAEALATGTAQLPRVVSRRPRRALGRSPAEAIASGLYHGHLGALSALAGAIAADAFGPAPCTVVCTGGAAALFRGEPLFAHTEPWLVLHGLRAFAER